MIMHGEFDREDRKVLAHGLVVNLLGLINEISSIYHSAV